MKTTRPSSMHRPVHPCAISLLARLSDGGQAKGQAKVQAEHVLQARHVADAVEQGLLVGLVLWEQRAWAMGEEGAQGMGWCGFWCVEG